MCREDVIVHNNPFVDNLVRSDSFHEESPLQEIPVHNSSMLDLSSCVILIAGMDISDDEEETQLFKVHNRDENETKLFKAGNRDEGETKLFKVDETRLFKINADSAADDDDEDDDLVASFRMVTKGGEDETKLFKVDKADGDETKLFKINADSADMNDIPDDGDDLVASFRMTIPTQLMPLDCVEVTEKMDLNGVMDVLDKIPWVKQYRLETDKIDVYVDYDSFYSLTYIFVIEILYRLTMRTEMEYHIHEMKKCFFSLCSGVDENVPKCNVTKGYIGRGENIYVQGIQAGVIGAFVEDSEGKSYALVTGHVIDVGQQCKLSKDVLLGICVTKLVTGNPPISYDLGVIRLEPQLCPNNMTPGETEMALVRFPVDFDEVMDMICYKLRGRSRDCYTYGYLMSVFTNNDCSIYRNASVIRVTPNHPVMKGNDCGCVFSSGSRYVGQKKNLEVMVLCYMMIGIFKQCSEDGGEDVEWYVGFPLKQALEELVQKDPYFRNKSLKLLNEWVM